MGSLRQVQQATGFYYEYSMDTSDAFRAAWPTLLFGMAVMAVSLTWLPHKTFPTPGSGFAAIFILVGILSFWRYRTTTWIIGPSGVAQERKWGNAARRTDLQRLKRVRIHSKWWFATDRCGGRCLVPADTLQHTQVVQALIDGVRASLQSGKVDMDAATALLASAPADADALANRVQVLRATQSRTINPVINRALNIWMIGVGILLALSLIFLLLIKL